MTEKSMLWATGTSGDGTAAYTEAETIRLFRSLVGGDPTTEGVLPGVDNELAVTGSTSPLSVNSGVAFVNGYFYWNTAAVNVTVTTPVVGTTGHRVVLRVSNSAKTVRIALISSSDGVSSYPALTQTDGVTWEIPLANLTITTGGAITLSDARGFVHLPTKVSSGMIDSAAVGLTQLASAVTAKLVTNGDSHDHNGGDGSQIPGGGIADDSVTDVKVGNRVPQFYRRQGGGGSNWSVQGASTYVPTMVRMQSGVKSAAVVGSDMVVDITITYPVAFSDVPHLMIFPWANTAGPDYVGANITDQTATGFTVRLAPFDTLFSVGWAYIHWLAIGPE